jgi:CheY-like chemotaxis protein
MNKAGPIVIIEDDLDDQDILKMVLEKIELTNKVQFFDNALDALSYLSNPENNPFIIISDINMPKMNGYQLREKVLASPHLTLKCIPYLFLSTDTSTNTYKRVYSDVAHGLFQKPRRLSEWSEMLQNIVNYWKVTSAPN